jgi:hypothetical protein
MIASHRTALKRNKGLGETVPSAVKHSMERNLSYPVLVDDSANSTLFSGDSAGDD